jgi:thioesterase domain-containing protein/ketosteroid isomerase-like protein
MLEDRSARFGSIEKMAAHYVDALREAQSKGPYLLGGWSFGGVIAIEMARQLKRNGHTVAQLVLFDAITSPSTWLDLLRRVDERLPGLTMLPAIFHGSVRGAGDSGRTTSEETSRLSENLALAAQSLAICDHHLTLWRHYTPAELDVPSTHFVPKERSPLRTLAFLGQSRKLPLRPLHTVPVQGNHFSMLGPANDLAKRLKDLLDATADREHTRDVASSPDCDETSVRMFLKQFVDSMEQRDSAALGAIYAADCISVSSGENILVGSETMKRHYFHKIASLKALGVHVHSWHVLMLARGQAACAIGKLDSDQAFHDGRTVSYRGTRITMVLEKQGEAWQVVHSHYSLPVGGATETIE